jgi:threonine synthase
VFSLFRGCDPGDYSVYDVMYTCPTCGGLLEVHHDLDTLRQRSAERVESVCSNARGQHPWPYGSGVWAMREWVMPDLRDENVVSMYEGNTNLFWAERLGRAGRPARPVDQAVRQQPHRQLQRFGHDRAGQRRQADDDERPNSPVKAVACASTGDTSAALAAYAAAAGIPAIIFLPSGKVSTAQFIQPIANGAHVLALDTDFDGCMRIVKELTQDNSIYLANSMNSIRIEGQKTVGVEIVRQFDWEVPDWIMIPVGNLGNISALYKGLKLMLRPGLIDKMPRLVAAQAAKPIPSTRASATASASKVSLHADKTLASAIQIGDPVSYEKAVQAIQATNGIVEQASEHELANAAALADRTGMYACPHTAVALAALFKLKEKGIIHKNDRTVVISTAHGLKFTQFKLKYHEGTLPEAESQFANPPVNLPADVELVKETIARRLEASEKL